MLLHRPLHYLDGAGDHVLDAAGDHVLVATGDRVQDAAGGHVLGLGDLLRGRAASDMM